MPAEPGWVGHRKILAEELLAAFGAIERRAVDDAGAGCDVARFVQLDEVVQVVSPARARRLRHLLGGLQHAGELLRVQDHPIDHAGFKPRQIVVKVVGAAA
jgi:hypothetical protein